MIKKTGLICLFTIIPFFIFSQSFKEENLEFPNTKQGFLLSGTLTTPDNQSKFPVAILLTGSGQTDRDETILGNKLFKSLAEGLSKQGIAVLRYDDRGGYKSKGPKVEESTSSDLVEDALSAVAYLKEKFPGHKIGLIGHSEGGGLAPIAAVSDTSISYIVSLAGLVVSGKEILIKQNIDIFRKSGADSTEVMHYIKDFFEPVIETVATNQNEDDKLQAIKELGKSYNEKRKNAPVGLKMNASEGNAKIFLKQMNNPWFIDFIKTRPFDQWINVNCPALAINGTFDIQVDASLNLGLIETLNKPNIQIIKLPKHNHLFQIAEKGTLDEYAKIKTGMSEELINLVANFINKL